MPVMSTAGLKSAAKCGLYVGAPAILGFTVGVMSFGNSGELRNLLRNGFTYSREMKEVRRESYWQ